MMRRLFSRIRTAQIRAAQIRTACQGSVAVEFALLAPVLLVLVFGVLYVGIALQNYNALRNLSADVARYAVIAHQSGNTLSSSQLRSYAVTHAQGAPYLLHGDRVNATITTPEVQRVAGATELQIVVTYQVESMLEFAGIDAPYMIYTRPIFVLDNTAA
jgi:Flp pilus assembly protein TadG